MSKREEVKTKKYWNDKLLARKLYKLIVGDIWESTTKTFNIFNGIVTKEVHRIKILSESNQGIVIIEKDGEEITTFESDIQISILRHKAKKV